MTTISPERRKFARSALAPRFELNLLQSRVAVPATGVNVSEGGLCLRVRQALEIRSLVRLRFTPEGGASRSPALRPSHPVECTGRVAWVVQRLDLGNAPPFLYDVGIEFVDLPPALRQLVASEGRRPAPMERANTLPPVLIRDRRYVPKIAREANHPLPWHLIVLVDGSPCFSGRYATKREAIGGWEKFRRQQAKLQAWDGKRAA